MVCMDYGSPRAMKLAYAVLVVWGSQLKLCLYISVFIFVYELLIVFVYVFASVSVYDIVSDHLESLSTSVIKILTAGRLNDQCSELYG